MAAFEQVETDSVIDVVVLGDERVGQPELIEQFAGHVRRKDLDGTEFTNLEIVHGRRIGLNLILHENEEAEGVVVMFDVGQRESFDNLPAWFQRIKENHTQAVRVALIGNKKNATDQRVVSREEAEECSRLAGGEYFETTSTDHECVRTVLRAFAKSIVGGTAMHGAAASGSVEAVEDALVQQAVDIDAADWRGQTPMYYAIEQGHVSVIEALVRLGSKAIDTPNKYGWTPMHSAGWNGDVSAIEALFRLGSKAIDTPATYGCTPMYAAALNGHVSAIEALVRLGSNAIDTPDKYGCTPLFEAALNGHVSAIEALVRLGSKAIDIPETEGCTPLYYAASNGHVNVIEALVRLGSNAIDTPNLVGDVPMTRANEPCRFVLRALGARSSNSDSLSTDNEDEVAEVRYRVYFSRSLTHRLVCFALP